MARTEESLPEWMLRLENKRKKQHRLAHDIGAGAPCFICENKCPGLDLHFWRKLCRNCKCKKEDHDVKDDEGYEQFEILLGSDRKKTRKGGYLNIIIPDGTYSPIKPLVNSNKEVAFDWIPPNVSNDVAAEYMRQLPASKLPISGSDGALYRRQQLEKQVPLHDLNAEHCHNLTPQEIEELMKYLENLKNNVVGLGCVGKIPVLPSKTRASLLDPREKQAHNEALGRSLSSSQSADPIRPLPPMPPAYNSAARPFHASTPSSAYGSGEEDDMPPALPTSLPPWTDLRTPSDFIDWRLLNERSSCTRTINEGMQNMHLNTDVPSQLTKNSFCQFSANSNELPKQLLQISGKLSPQFPGKAVNQSYSPAASLAVSSDVELATQQYSSVLGENDLKESGVAQSRSHQGNTSMNRHLRGQGSLVMNMKDPIDPTGKAFLGASLVSEVPLNSNCIPGYADKIQEMKGASQYSPSAVNISVSQTTEAQDCLVNDLNKATESVHIDSKITSPVSIKDVLTNNMVFAEVSHLGAAVPLAENNYSNALDRGEGKWNSSTDDPAGLSSEIQHGSLGGSQLDQMSTLPIDGVLTSNLTPQSIIQSDSLGIDALPKSAEVLKQQPHALLDITQTVANAGQSRILPLDSLKGSTAHLDCQECGENLMVGDIAVFAERAGNAAWHPSCFVCTTCKELLVDLMYFYHQNNVYCGRHFADLLGIPRCFACDELIFVKEYTVAEEKCFHIKHFCCYECDDPLAGKQYISIEDQPVCLVCYDRIYGKKCHTCKKKVAPSEQRVGWKDLNWHVLGNCFRCYECSKSLLGGRFVVKENQPFCSKECVQAGLLKMSK